MGTIAEKPCSPALYSCAHSALGLLYLIASGIKGFFLNRANVWRSLKRASLFPRKPLTVAVGHANFFCFPGKKPPQAAVLKQFGPLCEAPLGSFLSGFALVVVAMPSNEWLWSSRVQQKPTDTGDGTNQSPEGSQTLPALLNRFPGSSETWMLHSFLRMTEWEPYFTGRMAIPQNLWSERRCPTPRPWKTP